MILSVYISFEINDTEQVKITLSRTLKWFKTGQDYLFKDTSDSEQVNITLPRTPVIQNYVLVNHLMTCTFTEWLMMGWQIDPDKYLK